MRSAAALATALLLTACAADKADPVPAGSTVLALGDSLTAGYGLRPEQAWPALLGERSGWQVINGGVSGDTTAGARQRLPALLEAHAPQLVIVTLGGNDMLRRVPEAETVANLTNIIDLVEASGARAVLVATPKPSIAGAVFQSLSPAPLYRRIAAARKVAFIEDAIADTLSDPRLKLDALHPNAEGHTDLADRFGDELRRIGLLR